MLHCEGLLCYLCILHCEALLFYLCILHPAHDSHSEALHYCCLHRPHPSCTIHIQYSLLSYSSYVSETAAIICRFEFSDFDGSTFSSTTTGSCSYRTSPTAAGWLAGSHHLSTSMSPYDSPVAYQLRHALLTNRDTVFTHLLMISDTT